MCAGRAIIIAIAHRFFVVAVVRVVVVAVAVCFSFVLDLRRTLESRGASLISTVCEIEKRPPVLVAFSSVLLVRTLN